MPVTHRLIALTGLWLSWAASAQAQPPRDGLEVSLGVGAAPDYLGSNDYQAAPLPGFEHRRGGWRLRSNNLGLEVGRSLGAVSLGAIARLEPGRNDVFDVKDRVVERLTPVKAGAELGAVAETAIPLSALEGGLLVARVSLVRLTGKSGGWLMEASAGPLLDLSPTVSLGAFLTASVQSEGYAERFFSVDARSAAAAGLHPFEADGGVRDVGVSLLLTQTISERIAVSGIAAFTRLQGDARRSPIVRDRGAAGQGFAGVSLTYRFVR